MHTKRKVVKFTSELIYTQALKAALNDRMVKPRCLPVLYLLYH